MEAIYDPEDQPEERKDDHRCRAEMMEGSRERATRGVVHDVMNARPCVCRRWTVGRREREPRQRLKDEE